MHVHIIGDHGRNTKIGLDGLGKGQPFTIKSIHEAPNCQPDLPGEMALKLLQLKTKGVIRHLWRHDNKQLTFGMVENVRKINFARSLGGTALAHGQQPAQSGIGGPIRRITQQ